MVEGTLRTEKRGGLGDSTGGRQVGAISRHRPNNVPLTVTMGHNQRTREKLSF